MAEMTIREKRKLDALNSIESAIADLRIWGGDERCIDLCIEHLQDAKYYLSKHIKGGK
jgi:hypothetical protein